MGLSAYTLEVSSSVRRRKVRANICSILGNSDILCVQETKLNVNEGTSGQGALSGLKVDSEVYYSNLKRNSAGVATVIRRDFACKHLITRIALPPLLDGFALALKFVPIAQDAPSFIVVNCYLDSNSGYAAKGEQVKALMSIPIHTFSYFVGDWNFTLLEEDTSSKYTPPTTSFLEVWQRFIDRFSLKEISQPLHTWYRITKDKTQSLSKRLDRIYVSHTETDLTLHPIAAAYCAIPHSIFKTGNDSETEGVVWKGCNARVYPSVSDHVPVRLAPMGPKGKGSPHIPRWMAEDPLFESIFLDLLERSGLNTDNHRDPFLRHRQFVAIAFQAKKHYFLDKSEAARLEASKMSRLSACLHGLRLLSHHTVDQSAVSALCAQFPFIEDCLVRVEGGGTCVALLRAEADNLIHSIHREEAEAKMNSNPPSTFLTNLKDKLPSQRERLPGLRPGIDEEMTDDPEAMAALAGDYWTKVWAKSAVSPEAARSFLKRYHRQINPALCPSRLDKNHFIPIINSTNNSCAGPDGLPFAIYRIGVKLYSSIAADIFNALADGLVPPAGFNYGVLFLLPKKGLGTPDDTRPISVTNACNRIIAKGVLSCIVPALKEFIHSAQKGFVPGRDSGDHIRELNELFYKALEVDESELFVLFIDTQKAFDSVDHDFLSGVLSKIGFPTWVINIVKGLLSRVSVTPVFGGRTSVWIDILRGVKQGCPLSPLLFAVCYDPLLTRLAEIKGLKVFGFADDVALAAASFRDLCKAMEIIDLFSAASGLAVNVRKTTLINTKLDEVAVTKLVAASPWSGLSVVKEGLYLGILMGREVKLSDVFAKATAKFEARAAAYYPAVRRMHFVERVTTFNVFLHSLFSYLINFYSYPYVAGTGAQLSVVEGTAHRLIVNFPNAYPYDQLIQPRSRFGTGTPVKDLWSVSIANLAAQADLNQWDGATQVEPSNKFRNAMRMASHVQAAGADFVFIFLNTCESEGVPPKFVASRFVRENKAKMRRLILDYILLHEYRSQQDLGTQRALARRGLPSDQVAVDYLHSHYAQASPNLPPRCRRVLFQMVTNSLATQRRVMVIHTPQKDLRDLQPRPLCLLCKEGTDDAEHIYGECSVVREAREIYSDLIEVSLDPYTLLKGLSLKLQSFIEGGRTMSIELGEDKHAPPTVIVPAPIPVKPPVILSRPIQRRRRSTGSIVRKKRRKGAPVGPPSPPFSASPPDPLPPSLPVPPSSLTPSSPLSPLTPHSSNHPHATLASTTPPAAPHLTQLANLSSLANSSVSRVRNTNSSTSAPISNSFAGDKMEEPRDGVGEGLFRETAPQSERTAASTYSSATIPTTSPNTPPPPSASATSSPSIYAAAGALFKVTSYLTFPAREEEVTNAIMVFNAAVWRQRCTFFSTTGQVDQLSTDSAAVRLARAAKLEHVSCLTSQAATLYGNAATRTPEQRKRAKDYAAGKLSALREGTAVAFTDGSSLGNPGPTGAGCSLWVKGTEGKVDPIESTVALGHGTNNLAEVWGVGMALSLVRNLPIAGRPYRLVIFTDSNFTISVIQGSATSAEFALHVHAIRSLHDDLAKDKIVGPFELSWVPGHAGLEENELVDALAKRGADASRRGICVVNCAAYLRQRCFLYHLRPP